MVEVYNELARIGLAFGWEPTPGAVVFGGVEGGGSSVFDGGGVDGVADVGGVEEAGPVEDEVVGGSAIGVAVVGEEGRTD